MKKEKEYCTHCGTEMVVVERPQEKRFDRKTGKPLNTVYKHWKYPKKKIFFDSHDEWDDEPVGIGGLF